MTLPLLPGVLAFSVAYGSLAAQKGLSLAEATAMSGIVFAGAAQLVALEIWTERLTLGAVLTLAMVTAIVNIRFVLMGASLRPWFAPLPASQVYPSLLLTTDANWLIAMSYRGRGGADAGVFLGAGAVLWFAWTVFTVPSYFLGSLAPDPRPFALDLVLPAFFTAMLIPLWRGARRALGWIIAGLCAVIVARMVEGYWFIVAGALAGSFSSALLEHDAES